MTAPPNSRFLLHPSPVGEVLIVTTDEGIVTLHPLRDRLENELERLSRVLRSIPDRADDDAVAADAAQQLDEYFAGERQRLRPAAGLAARPGVHARRPRGRPRHPLRRDGGLWRGRRQRRQSARSARGRNGVRDDTRSRSSCRCIGWCGQTVRIGEYGGHPEDKAFLLDLERAASE